MTKRIAIWITIFALLLLSGCATRPYGSIYKGKYFYHFEASTFTENGSTEHWCVNSVEMERARLPEKEAPSPFGGSWGSADVVLRGKLSPRGNYCSLGGSPHILKVYDILEIKNMKAGDP